VDCQRIEDAHPEGWRGHVVANLPYGERLFQAESYPEELARCFARAEGAHVTVLTMGEAFAKAMWSVARRKPTRWLNVDNGGLDCVLLHFAARARR
jgi:23S rRNA G2445 N2-methylase RlmL